MNIELDATTTAQLLELTRIVKKNRLEQGFSEEVCATVLAGQLLGGVLTSALYEEKFGPCTATTLADLVEKH
jgi:hypothetical protein